MDPMAGGNGPDAQDFRTLANESGGAVAKFGVQSLGIGTAQWHLQPRTRAAISLGAEVLYRQMENTYRLELGLPSVLTTFPSSPNSFAIPFIASMQNAICSSKSTPSSAAPLVMSLRLTLRANALS